MDPAICTHMHPYSSIRIHTHPYPPTHLYIYTSIHRYIYTSIHPYIYTSIHISIHLYIYTYIHISIHIYISIHISIHIYIWKKLKCNLAWTNCIDFFHAIFIEVHFLLKPLLRPLGTIVWSFLIQKSSRFSSILHIISGLLP